MWTITNSGPAMVVVYDASVRPRAIDSGQTAIVDIDARQASRLASNKALRIVDQDGNRPPEGYKTRRQIKAAAPSAAVPAQRKAQRVEVKEEQKTRRQYADELIAQYENRAITYPVFVDRVKKLFGGSDADEWPGGGVPKKSVVYDLLRRIDD